MVLREWRGELGQRGQPAERALAHPARCHPRDFPALFRRALLPNLASSIVSASFLTATVVLGEFTIAVTLAKNTFPTFSYEYFGRDPQGGIALALLTLLATTFLLAVLTLAARPKAVRATRKAERQARRQKTTTIAEPAQ